MHSTQLTALAAAAMAARLLQIERECREIARRIREKERRAAMVRQDPQNMAPIMPLHVRPLCTKWVMSCSTCPKWKWDICHNNDNFLTFPFEHINHARSGMIFQALHQGLQHTLKRIFPSATVIKYFNVITSSPLFQEFTHSGVAPALCSTLGTTLYFSVSLSLLVVRVQVALHL